MTFERKPGTSRWEGTLSGNELRFTGKTTYELRLSGTDELRGFGLSDQGRGTVVLKRRQ
jgi:hypothetical protein